MSASLVGSEMCIRDSSTGAPLPNMLGILRRLGQLTWGCEGHCRAILRPVSYTHLTLPTICSV
eukprot:13413815-Alexandrium_andersonii.AAC.1